MKYLSIWIALVALLAGCRPARSGPVTQTTALLSWTAVGDDSLSGRAMQYDLRYSTSVITAANFSAATRFPGTPTPAFSGARDSVVVTGLSPATTYWFAIKTADEIPNWSGISNVVSVTTLPPPDVMPPAAVRDLKIGWLAVRPMLVGVRW